MKKIDIIIPVMNEAQNIVPLCRRFQAALSRQGIDYRLIFVVDPSTDDTLEKIVALQKKYPIVVHQKQGEPGKAFSIFEGAARAETDYVVMIDGDLQYPPEAIPTMLAEADTYGVVVADRTINHATALRRVLSKINRFVFGKVILGIDCDIQSGLKVFRKNILDHIEQKTIKEWSFDIPLLFTALELGYSIGSVPITFEKRLDGRSKVNVLHVASDIISSALLVRFSKKKVYHIKPHQPESVIGAGVTHRRKTFITHSMLPHEQSALHTLKFWQKAALVLGLTLLGGGLILRPMPTAIVFIGVLSFIYFLDVIFNFFLVMRSLHRPVEINIDSKDIDAVVDANVPVYSILCPLYKEAHVLPEFIVAIERLEWPKEKLEVLLLLEENDTETLDAARSLSLPGYIKIITVPDSQPKTKPKACNYGLALASGEYLVIYDAEDRPDSDQLKKAYLAFQKAPADIACLQAKLNYYNPHQNILTRLFAAEYSLWFDVTLPGLQSLGAIIPLGGTSNHFRRAGLLALCGWDPFNVTEDCDLGARLFKAGYKTAIINSITLEEANSRFGNWLRQRSRWIKGYMQTYLVHMRDPIDFLSTHGIQAIIFQLVVGGKIAFILINPILWLATIAYFALNALVGPTIEALYPPVIFYMAGTSLVFGNFLCLYYYMIGTAKREHWTIIKYVFLVPVYWLMISLAACIAVGQLITKPHYWEKTNHGLQVKRSPLTPAVATNWAAAEPRVAPETVRSLAARGGLLMAAAVVTNLLNLGFNLVVSRALDFKELAVVSLVNTLWYVAALVFGALVATVTHHVAYVGAGHDNKEGKPNHFMVLWLAVIGVVGLAVSGIWIAASPYLQSFFHLDNQYVIWLFTPVFIGGAIGAANSGYLQGQFRFAAAGFLLIFEALVRLTAAASFIALGRTDQVYSAISIATVATALVSLWLVRSSWLRVGTVSRPEKFPGTFFVAALIGGAAVMAFLSFDIILVKHFLSEEVAGQYALLSLVGKIIFFLGSIPNLLTNPLVSRKAGHRRSAELIFMSILAATSSIVAVAILGLIHYGWYILPLLFGSKAVLVLPYVNNYILAAGLFTISNVIVTYHLAKKQYLFPLFFLVAATGMIASIVKWHADINQVVYVLLNINILTALFLGLLHIYLQLYLLVRNFGQDLAGLFVSRERRFRGPSEGGQKILIFNWRDPKHVFVGGAEVYITEIARRWVQSGHTVTLVCGNDGRSRPYEVVDGIEVFRHGGFYQVYAWAAVYYLLRLRGQYDIIVDCHNGIPFFTPLYAKEKIFCVIYHIHQDVFRRSLLRPLAALAQWLESRLMPAVYRNVPIITISESSKQDILNLGLGNSSIHIIHPGVDGQKFTPGQKAARPVVAYLGRLKAYKSVDVLIRAFVQVQKNIPDARLIIAGEGEEEYALRHLVDHLGMREHIAFKGRVTETEKKSLLQKAWVAVNPSFFEGWGITTIEANACGTPVVAANVAGLRDSVIDTKTGYLVDYGDSGQLAEKIELLLSDSKKRLALGREARRWAENFEWDKSADLFLATLEATVETELALDKATLN